MADRDANEAEAEEHTASHDYAGSYAFGYTDDANGHHQDDSENINVHSPLSEDTEAPADHGFAYPVFHP